MGGRWFNSGFGNRTGGRFEALGGCRRWQELLGLLATRAGIPLLSAGVCSGSKALSYIGLAQAAAPPPKFSAQLFSVGRFHLCFPHDTRGSRTFCVCDPAPVAWQEHPRLPSVPPSLLSKSALTASPWHTHMAFCDHDLHACHCHSLSGGLGVAIHHANTAAAQGMEYKPARCCVTTSAP